MTEANKRQILIPTDFSKCSISAFECAMYWSTKIPVELHFYHRIAGMPREWESGVEDLRKTSPKISKALLQAQQKFDTWAKILKKANIPYSFNFSGGNVGDYAAKYVDDQKIDYIFMGSHGEAKKDREKLGSNAIDVLVKGSTPVLVTKEIFDDGGMDAVVFASNFDKEARGAFVKVLEFVRPFNPVIHLLHIDTPKIFSSTKFITVEAMEDFCRIASDFQTKKHFHKDSNVGHGIVDFCNDLGVDIITFSESGNTIFGGSRLARPVKYLVQNANQPVFFVQNEAEIKQ